MAVYQALYRKWRPQTFADVIGQQHITDTLRAQVQANRLSHAYLFTGTRGTGKTTCAKILSRAANCEQPVDGNPCNQCPACLGILDGSIMDVTEIDAASNNGVDNIRDLRDETRYTPAQVRKRVFIIDEVHMLSSGAFNALLKTLEEPPDYVLFILATTELQKVPATILSRCQRFDFRRIDIENIADRLLYIAEQENISLSKGAARLIARLADGAMRDALSMLDRAAAAGAVDEKTVAAALGILGQDDALQLAEKIKRQDLTATVNLLGEYYNAGRDLAGVYEQLLELIRDALLVKTSSGNDAELSTLISPAYSMAQLHALCDGLAASTLLAWSEIISRTLDRMRKAINRRMEAELCAVRLCTAEIVQENQSLSGRIEALEEKIKYGVPVAAPQEELAPPPDENDAPPWAIEDQSPTPRDETPEQSLQQPTWRQWEKLLETVKIKLGTPVYVFLDKSARGIIEENALVILCEDPATEAIIRLPQNLQIIREIVAELNGKPLNVTIRLIEDDQSASTKKNNIDPIRERAKTFDIPVKSI